MPCEGLLVEHVVDEPEPQGGSAIAAAAVFSLFSTCHIAGVSTAAKSG